MNIKKETLNYIKVFITFALAIVVRLICPAEFVFSADTFGYISVITLLVIMICGLKKGLFVKQRFTKLELLGFGVFSFFTTLGYIYGRQLSLHDMNLFMSAHCLVSAVVNFSLAQYGYMILKYLMAPKQSKPLKSKFLSKQIQKNSFFFYFAVLFVSYLGFLIINYPGVLMYDPVVQILQIYKIPNITTNQVNLIDPNQFITTHHPFIHTMLIKLFLYVGELAGSLDVGIFLYSLFQITIMALAIAYLLTYIHKYFSERGMRNWLILFSLNPIVLMYSQLMTKDTLFAVFVALFGIKFYEYIKNNKVLKDKKWLLSFLVVVVLCSLFRNNFFYAAFLTFVVMLIIKKDKKLLKTFALFLCVYFAYTSVLVPGLGVTKGSIREAISVPFQQTANYAKYYDVTEEEKEIISKILDFETVEAYNSPEVSNSVKNTFNKNATNEELFEYFKVWAKMFFKHPLAYFDAYFNQFYGYFSTQPYLSASYSLEPNMSGRNDLINAGVELEKTMPFMTAKEHYDAALILISSMPVFYLITNSGIYIWIIMSAIVCLRKTKNKKYIWFYLPFILYFLTLLLSPANASIEYRYMYPYLISLPILLAPVREVLKANNTDELNTSELLMSDDVKCEKQ